MTVAKFTLAKKLWLLTGIGIFVIATIAGTTHYFFKALVGRIHDTTQAQLPLVKHSQSIATAHDKIRAAVFRGIFGAQIQIDEELAAAFQELETGKKMILANIEALNKLPLSTEQSQASLKTAEDVSSYLKTAEDIFSLLKQNRITFALELQADFQTKFDNVNVDLAIVQENTERSVNDSLSETSKIVSSVRQTTAMVSLAGILLSLGLSLIMIRGLMATLTGLIRRLTEQENNVRSFTSEIESIAKNLSNSTSAQASAVEQTAASLEEISAMVDRSSEHSQILLENSEKSTGAAENGVKSVQSMLEAMSEIGNSSASMVTKFEESNQRILQIIHVINEISDRTKIINEIVMQTKLLSFNASVEAARAGEHGKGFAIVAQEIGALATKSGQSSQEISEMLSSGIGQVTSIIDRNKTEMEQLISKNAEHVEIGKRVALSCGESLDLLAKQVTEVATLSAQISGALSEQKTGVGEINRTVTVFSTTAMSTAKDSQESLNISGKLQEQFNLLHNLTEELTGLVTGAASSSYSDTLGDILEDRNSTEPNLKFPSAS